MTSSTRLAVVLGLQLAAGAALIACGSDGGDEPAAGPTGGPGTVAKPGDGVLALAPSSLYSAFVPGHEAQLPVQLKDTSLRTMGAKFTSSDPTVATVTDTADGATITVKKEGTTFITGTLGEENGKAKLTVKGYTEEQWKTGQARYSKTDLAIVPKDGAAVSAIALLDPTARNPNGACTTCHTSQAQTLGIENGPTQIAGYSDAELITIFTEGKKPETAVQKSMIPSFIWGMFHTWTVTEDEKQGLIAFLRTQPPKANPAMIDYGVKPCPGTTATAGAMPMLCDNNGKPINIPGRDAGTGRPATPATGGGSDAGVPATTTGSDAGTTTTAGDAG